MIWPSFIWLGRLLRSFHYYMCNIFGWVWGWKSNKNKHWVAKIECTNSLAKKNWLKGGGVWKSVLYQAAHTVRIQFSSVISHNMALKIFILHFWLKEALQRVFVSKKRNNGVVKISKLSLKITFCRYAIVNYVPLKQWNVTPLLGTLEGEHEFLDFSRAPPHNGQFTKKTRKINESKSNFLKSF